MRHVQSRTRQFSTRRILTFAAPVLVLFFFASGCGQKNDAESEANAKRMAEYLKANPQDTTGIQRSYELRQAQLAARRKKAAEGKSATSPSTEKPSAAEKPSSAEKQVSPSTGH